MWKVLIFSPVQFNSHQIYHAMLEKGEDIRASDIGDTYLSSKKNIFFKVVSASTSLHNGVFQARPFPIFLSFTVSARNFSKGNVILGNCIPHCSWFEHAGKNFQFLGFNRSQKNGERKGEEEKLIELYRSGHERKNQPRQLGKLEKVRKRTYVKFIGEVEREGFTLKQKRTLRWIIWDCPKEKEKRKVPIKKATVPGVPKRSPIQVLTGRYRA